MFRYMAILWNESDPSESQAAEQIRRRVQTHIGTHWKSGLSRAGLAVFYQGDRIGEMESHALPNGSGVILGTLFRRPADELDANPISSLRSIEPGQAARIIATEGRELIDSYWGCYVAFLAKAHSKWLIKGPMSDLTCYLTHYMGVRFVFSRIEDCIALKLCRFSVNWDYLKVHVAFHEPRTTATALNEVTIIEGGECLHLEAATSSRRFYWNPCLIAKSDTIDHWAAAVEATRVVTQRVVHAWASCHERILHRLSGGIDSSVALACLATAPTAPIVTCQILYSPGATGDERRYARASALKANCQLIERERDPNVDLGVFRTMPPSPSPMRHYTAFESQELEYRLAGEIGATAMFCGGVGDQVFGTGVNEMVAADFVAHYGIRSPLLQISLDVARRRKVSVWKVLRKAIFQSPARSSNKLWHDYLYRDEDLLPTHYKGLASNAQLEDIRPKIDRFVHPWYRSADGVPEYKLWSISGLTAEMCYDAPFTSPDGPPLVSPFASQPLVELCLRIESHLKVRGGWDRAVVREAFSHDLPDVVRTRTAKGGGDFWMHAAVQRNMTFIREYLLNGLLVGTGLLDYGKLAGGLSPSPSKTSLGYLDIIRHLHNEAWLRNWSESEQALRTIARTA
jgi:asparagine synthase (glutamine-hydrolysing)